MKEKPLYFCDPSKNTECSKAYCFYNPVANYNSCFATTNPKCAICKSDKPRLWFNDYEFKKGHKYWNKKEKRIRKVLLKYRNNGGKYYAD